MTAEFASWLEAHGDPTAAQAVRGCAATSPLGGVTELAGPVGEANVYAIHPRGTVLLLPETQDGLVAQLAAGLATGNDLVVGGTVAFPLDLPKAIAARVRRVEDWQGAGPYAGALIEGDVERVRTLSQVIAALPGPIVLTQAASAGYRLDWLVEEVSTSINTTAAGGNASLMAMA